MDNERILDKIEELMEQRDMTRYKLAKISGIKHSTLTTMLNKRSVVSITNLNKICRAFGMKLSEFISLVEDNPGSHNVSDFPIAEWEPLTPEYKHLIIYMMQGMRDTFKNRDK